MADGFTLAVEEFGKNLQNTKGQWVGLLADLSVPQKLQDDITFISEKLDLVNTTFGAFVDVVSSLLDFVDVIINIYNIVSNPLLTVIAQVRELINGILDAIGNTAAFAMLVLPENKGEIASDIIYQSAQFTKRKTDNVNDLALTDSAKKVEDEIKQTELDIAKFGAVIPAEKWEDRKLLIRKLDNLEKQRSDLKSNGNWYVMEKIDVSYPQRNYGTDFVIQKLKNAFSEDVSKKSIRYYFLPHFTEDMYVGGMGFMMGLPSLVEFSRFMQDLLKLFNVDFNFSEFPPSLVAPMPNIEININSSMVPFLHEAYIKINNCPKDVFDFFPEFKQMKNKMQQSKKGLENKILKKEGGLSFVSNTGQRVGASKKVAELEQLVLTLEKKIATFVDPRTQGIPADKYEDYKQTKLYLEEVKKQIKNINNPAKEEFATLKSLENELKIMAEREKEILKFKYLRLDVRRKCVDNNKEEAYFIVLQRLGQDFPGITDRGGLITLDYYSENKTPKILKPGDTNYSDVGTYGIREELTPKAKELINRLNTLQRTNASRIQYADEITKIQKEIQELVTTDKYYVMEDVGVNTVLYTLVNDEAKLEYTVNKTILKSGLPGEGVVDSKLYNHITPQRIESAINNNNLYLIKVDKRTVGFKVSDEDIAYKKDQKGNPILTKKAKELLEKLDGTAQEIGQNEEIEVQLNDLKRKNEYYEKNKDTWNKAILPIGGDFKLTEDLYNNLGKTQYGDVRDKYKIEELEKMEEWTRLGTQFDVLSPSTTYRYEATFSLTTDIGQEYLDDSDTVYDPWLSRQKTDSMLKILAQKTETILTSSSLINLNPDYFREGLGLPEKDVKATDLINKWVGVSVYSLLPILKDIRLVANDCLTFVDNLLDTGDSVVREFLNSILNIKNQIQSNLNDIKNSFRTIIDSINITIKGPLYLKILDITQGGNDTYLSKMIEGMPQFSNDTYTGAFFILFGGAGENTIDGAKKIIDFITSLFNVENITNMKEQINKETQSYVKNVTDSYNSFKTEGWDKLVEWNPPQPTDPKNIVK